MVVFLVLTYISTCLSIAPILHGVTFIFFTSARLFQMHQRPVRSRMFDRAGDVPRRSDLYDRVPARKRSSAHYEGMQTTQRVRRPSQNESNPVLRVSLCSRLSLVLRRRLLQWWHGAAAIPKRKRPMWQTGCETTSHRVWLGPIQV